MVKALTRFSIAMLLVLGAAPVVGATTELGIITGGEKGTYYQFGLNLQALAKQHGVSLSVFPSRGSIENVYAVYQRPATQLGIVQSDVLAFVSRVQTDPVLKRIAKKTKMVFPLYNEEIHILGRPGIAEFDDLSDRRVAIGREGSGTYLTARLLFNVAEVVPREMVPIDTDEALAELKAGRIDAMFYVAGYPVKLFAEGVTETRRSGARSHHEQEHHRVLSTGGGPGQDVRVAAESGRHGGREVRSHILRLPPPGLRYRREVRQDDRGQHRLAHHQRASEVEGG